MKKTINKYFLLGVALIMSLGIFSACSSGLWFKVDYEGKGHVNGAFSFTDASGAEFSNHNSITLIKSVEELIVLCANENNPAFLENNPQYSSDLSKKIREYNEAYFVENALIVSLLTASNSGITYTIKSIEKENETLSVNIKTKKTKGISSTVITPWTFLIEVKKVDITAIVDVDYRF